MRVARAYETLDDRRQVIVELMDFIRDFNKLDTTLLVQRVMSEQKFLEAAEAVLLSAVGPWNSVEALRDFCVHNLMGEKPIDEPLAEKIRPHGRVTPFSVPFALLRAMAPRNQFDPHRLRSLSLSEAIELRGASATEDRWPINVGREEAWLITTMWGRAIPKPPLTGTQIIVHDEYANRQLHDGKLWALLADAIPCFWWLPPVGRLEVKITQQRFDEPITLMLVIEGWRYITG